MNLMNLHICNKGLRKVTNFFRQNSTTFIGPIEFTQIVICYQSFARHYAEGGGFASPTHGIILYEHNNPFFTNYRRFREFTYFICLEPKFKFFTWLNLKTLNS